MAYILLLLLISFSISSAHLSTNHYSETCPNLLSTIRPVVGEAIAKEKRMGASLLRLLFHDCFVQGCDASILLDDNGRFKGEKNARPNKNSARGFEVIDKIKSEVERVCPGIVSCADILAIAARDSVDILGGPKWSVSLGRRDSRTASFAGANSNIPSPTSSLSNLISIFNAKGLSTKDMVALSGSHTIGQAKCATFRNRIYHENNIDSSFAKARKSNCPKSSGDNNLSPLDLLTPTEFDNNYYNNLISLKGLLHSDQQLFSNGSTDSQVQKYAQNTNFFFNDFVAAMIKMASISTLSGSNGEIRKNCRRIN